MKKILSITIILLTLVAFVGCAEKTPSIPNVPVKDIFSNIETKVESVSSLTELNFKSEELSDFDKLAIENFGINPEDLEEGIAKYPMINLQVNEVIILKAKDETKLESLKEAINTHIEKQIKSFENYVPKNVEIINNHILKTKGNYILLAISQNTEEIEAAFDESFEVNNQ